MAKSSMYILRCITYTLGVNAPSRSASDSVTRDVNERSDRCDKFILQFLKRGTFL